MEHVHTPCLTPKLPAGLYGTVLPPLIYASGSVAQHTSASLTLTNVSIVYDKCVQELWQPAVDMISDEGLVCAKQ